MLLKSAHPIVFELPDLFFIRRCSLGLYLRIVLRTPGRVLSGRDAW